MRPNHVLAALAALSVLSAAPIGRAEQLTGEPVFLAQSSAGFAAWREGFRARARAHGITGATFDRAFEGVSYNPSVIEKDRRQAEFTKQIWEYLDTAVSATRISNGREKAREWQAELAGIEARYGVDARVVLAIWGMESAYGGFTGDYNVIEALATLAYDGRRRGFAEEQLIAALKIVQSGDKDPARMLGSWAGAMGHTQFIPTSFLAYAVDFTGDGTRDIWFPPDALASTANYLRESGWQKGRPWGVEVALPRGFDWSDVDPENRQSVATWRSRGVTLAGGGTLPDHGAAGLFAPAGGRGPVFAVFHNFRVIKRYNNANSYALAVGHLGDRIYGGPGFSTGWPRDDRALTRDEKVELQNLLARAGFPTGGADGKIGPKTLAAVRAFQRAAGLVPDGYVSLDLLRRLR
jgi:membrane-bound lytic murein transglycosylase B